MELRKVNIMINEARISEVAGLRAKCGLAPRPDRDTKQEISSSRFCVSVYCNDELAAFARAKGDGMAYLQITDIMIDPEHDEISADLVSAVSKCLSRYSSLCDVYAVIRPEHVKLWKKQGFRALLCFRDSSKPKGEDQRYIMVR